MTKSKKEETSTVEETVVENPQVEPAQAELIVPEDSKPLPEKRSKESIEAMIKEKLSRKTDSPDSDPFVPHSQVESEIVEVAKKSGFPLTRGTEVGARLLARTQRPKR